MQLPLRNNKLHKTDFHPDDVDLASAIDLNPEVDPDYSPSSTPAIVKDKAAIADLVAKYGSSSSTAWLEFDRYQIWRPTIKIPESEFVPVQGYMHHDPYIFAWGNPLVSDPAALFSTALAFKAWVDKQGLRLIWTCVDRDLEEVLAHHPFEWSVVHCIYEDMIDPAHVIDLARPDVEGREHDSRSTVKDLKKNLRRAQRAEVYVSEVLADEWTPEDKKAVEQGIIEWRKSRSGVQIASTTLEPWLDSRHRRYWLARHAGKPVGFLILTPIHNHSWQIKNAVSFPTAPRGTSETLIYTALSDLYRENPTPAPTPGSTQPSLRIQNHERTTVTFGITASEHMRPVQNLSGWKVTLLATIYGKVASVAGLLRRGEFRKKFGSEHEPMYVCYPQEGFGLDGVNTLLKLLRK
ncbi:hypothetical protein C0995_012388 [Termitomyces sp. Mi166|nr:hypothetical protein C0995_012388 [Termitomyces sp. Mi166\